MREQASSPRTNPVQADHLYFIRVADGPLKIGRSRDVSGRLSCLRTANPYPLTLVGMIDGGGADEWVWHTAFFGDRLEGEWFKWGKRMERAIELALGGMDSREALGMPPVEPERDWRKELGLDGARLTPVQP